MIAEVMVLSVGPDWLLIQADAVMRIAHEVVIQNATEPNEREMVAIAAVLSREATRRVLAEGRRGERRGEVPDVRIEDITLQHPMDEMQVPDLVGAVDAGYDQGC